MGKLADVKDGLKTLVAAAVSSDVVVRVSVDPELLDVEKWPKAVVIVCESADHDDNQLVNAINVGSTYQEENWTWSLYVICGFSGEPENAVDAADAILAELKTGLLSKQAETNCGPLELREFAEFNGFAPNRVVYRQEWFHSRCEG